MPSLGALTRMTEDLGKGEASEEDMPDAPQIHSPNRYMAAKR